MADSGSTSSSSPDIRKNVDATAEKARRFTPAMFGVIALCFLLPFMSLTCSGQRLVTFNGLDLVLGSDVEPEELDLEGMFPFGEGFETEGTPQLEEAAEEGRLDPSIFAIIALGAAVAGLILALVLRTHMRNLASAIAAAVVAVSLIGIRFEVDLDIEDAEGFVSIDYRFGYWIALVVALAIIVVHVLELRTAKRGPPAAGVPPPAEA